VLKLFPSSHHREEGRPSDREAGVVFRRPGMERHPGCVYCGGFAKVFLMTPPPLLAVMPGGECLPLHSPLLLLRWRNSRRYSLVKEGWLRH